MTAHHDFSVEELRRESERSRAALSSTVVDLRTKVADTANELKTRLSPAHLKEEVKGYVRDGSEQFFHSIERKARENPLRAVAIGAGLAYPLWGLLRTIPVPLMLVGAGLLMSRQKRRAAEGNSVADTIGRSDGENSIVTAMQDAGAALAAGAETASDRVSEAAHDVRDFVAEKGKSIADSMASNAAAARNTVSAGVSHLGDQATEIRHYAQNALEDMADRNPLVVAGLGLAVGALIAACLPSSDTENRLLGERSDNLKDKARDAASKGVEVAERIMGDVADAAEGEGLSAEGLSGAVEDVTKGVKSVVDRGIRTALGEDPSPSSSSSSNLPHRYQS